MDPGGFQHGFQYNLLTFGDLEMSMVSAAQQLPAQVPVMPATAMLPAMPAPTTMAQQPIHSAHSVVMAEATSILPAGNGILPTPSSNSMHTASALMPAASSDMHSAGGMMPTAGSDVHSAGGMMSAAGSDMHSASAMMPTASSDFLTASSVVPTVSSDFLTASAMMPTASSDMPTASSDFVTASSVVPTASPDFLTASSVVPTVSSAMPPPSHPFWTQTTTSGAGESFNDSGYFSSPQTSQFTGLHPCLLATASSSGSQGVGSHNQIPSGSQVLVSQIPVGSQGVIIHSSQSPARAPRAPGSSTPRSNWQEDFPNISNISDEWDSSFLNNFEENLFSIDASDLNTIMEGILTSPFKSPSGSPFQSPSRSRNAAQGVPVSPLGDFPLSNVMLSAVKKSPGHADGSPFKNLFSTPSPIKGLNLHTRTSPMTRQRRRILQSPAQKPDALSDQLLDMPHFLSSKMDQNDDLGVTPFHRTNSMGFTPTERVSASPPFEENSALSSQPFVFENFMPSDQSVTATPTLQEISNMAHPRQHKRIKTERSHGLHDSPTKKSMLRNNPQSPSNQRSPLRLAQRRISVTCHSHLVDKLDPKGALRFVRARFAEVLQKAVENADKVMEAKLKACGKKRQQHPEMAQALSQPSVAGASSSSSVGGSSASVPACYTQIQPHRPAARRRQEILPKPTPDWPQRQPCKIAPKKRKH